ncbi:MAG TPA: NUDIX hydrolase [Elusimicrobiota bacterium]|nr:NUDIX hydrolase [Elusimicrobiota bacterium]HNG45756.1 NUDIX hydrolase [Elusimicrobiota bacterium]
MNKARRFLSGADHRRIEKSFANAGLPKKWWKAFGRELRHCARCGERLSWRLVRAEGQRRFVCGGCRWIFYQNPKIVAAALPVWKNKIVLLRRAIEPAKGLWSHPAGFMELGETVQKAAIRETREEIGCRVRLAGPARLYSYDDAAVVTVVYDAWVVGAGPRAGAESLEVKAFAADEIPWDRLAFRSTYHALRDWADRRSKS